MSNRQEMAEALHGGIRVRWSPSERLLTFEHPDQTPLTAEAADALIPLVEAWVSAVPGPYGILIDASRTRESAEAWRAKWIAFHRRDPERARIAFYRAGIFVQGILMLYGHAAQVRLKCCDTERDARAWLAENGVPVQVDPRNAPTAPAETRS